MTYHKPSPADVRGSVPMDQVRLESLEGWSVPDGFTDPRGLDVIATDGRKVGTVGGLLGSPSARRACFAIVEAGSWIARHTYAVPLSMISVRDGAAHVPVTHHRFADAPNWQPEGPDYDLITAYWQGRPLPEAGDAGAGEAVYQGQYVDHGHNALL